MNTLTGTGQPSQATPTLSGFAQRTPPAQPVGFGALLAALMGLVIKPAGPATPAGAPDAAVSDGGNDAPDVAGAADDTAGSVDGAAAPADNGAQPAVHAASGGAGRNGQSASDGRLESGTTGPHETVPVPDAASAAAAEGAARSEDGAKLVGNAPQGGEERLPGGRRTAVDNQGAGNADAQTAPANDAGRAARHAAVPGDDDTSTADPPASRPGHPFGTEKRDGHAASAQAPAHLVVVPTATAQPAPVVVVSNAPATDAKNRPAQNDAGRGTPAGRFSTLGLPLAADAPATAKPGAGAANAAATSRARRETPGSPAHERVDAAPGQPAKAGSLSAAGGSAPVTATQKEAHAWLHAAREVVSRQALAGDGAAGPATSQSRDACTSPPAQAAFSGTAGRHAGQPGSSGAAAYTAGSPSASANSVLDDAGSGSESDGHARDRRTDALEGARADASANGSSRAPNVAPTGVRGATSAPGRAPSVPGASAGTASMQARHVERIAHVQEAQAARPPHQVTLHVEDAQGVASRVKVALRGAGVQTQIDTGVVAAGELQARTGELRRALDRHGLRAEGVQIRPMVSDPAAAGVDRHAGTAGGHTPGRNGGRAQSDGRPDAQQQPQDRRPRQGRDEKEAS